MHACMYIVSSHSLFWLLKASHCSHVYFHSRIIIDQMSRDDIEASISYFMSAAVLISPTLYLSKR